MKRYIYYVYASACNPTAEPMPEASFPMKEKY